MAAAADGTLTELPGIGPSTAAVVAEAVAGQVPERITRLEATTQIRRQDFGLMPAIPSAMLGDVIKIELDLQLVEPATDS